MGRLAVVAEMPELQTECDCCRRLRNLTAGVSHTLPTVRPKTPGPSLRTPLGAALGSAPSSLFGNEVLFGEVPHLSRLEEKLQTLPLEYLREQVAFIGSTIGRGMLAETADAPG